MDIARVIVAVAFLAFIPGFAWSRILFPKQDLFARAVLAIGLSVAMVTVSVYVASAAIGTPVDAVRGIAASWAWTVAAGVPTLWRGLVRLVNDRVVAVPVESAVVDRKA